MVLFYFQVLIHTICTLTFRTITQASLPYHTGTAFEDQVSATGLNVNRELQWNLLVLW